MVDLYDIQKRNYDESSANFFALRGLSLIFQEKKSIRGSDPTYYDNSMKLDCINSGVAGQAIFGDKKNIPEEEWKELLSLVFSFASKEGISLLEKPGFDNWIKDNSGMLNSIIQTGRHKSAWGNLTPDYKAIIHAAFASGSSSADTVYKSRFFSYKEYRMSSFDAYLLMEIATLFPSVIIDHIESVSFVKDISYGPRGNIFYAIASSGNLSKKAARKIRSDSSEEASMLGIRAISENISKFKNAPEVLSQVMDTKHDSCATFLARNVAKEYLPFMVGCQDNSVRQIIVDRMSKDSAGGKNV
jgi:hypothetical protein